MTDTVVVIEHTTTVDVIEQNTIVEVAEGGLPGPPGPPGPQGPQGPPGSAGAQTVTLVAAQTLSGHRAIAVNSSGQAIYADHTSPITLERAVGVSTGAASSGQNVTVLVAGELVEPSWSWSPGPIYVGANGVLTQTAPVSGAVFQIGTAIAATKMIVDLKFVVQLAS